MTGQCSASIDGLDIFPGVNGQLDDTTDTFERGAGTARDATLDTIWAHLTKSVRT